MSTFVDAADRWDHARADAILTGGPERIYDNNPKPDLIHRPVGFIQPPVVEHEPLLWEGDNA